MRTASDGSAYTENNSWRIVAAAKESFESSAFAAADGVSENIAPAGKDCEDSEADRRISALSGVYPSAENVILALASFPVQDAAISAT